MDVRLPDGNGVEACREIRSRWPKVKVLMLTSFADDEALFASIMAGHPGTFSSRSRATISSTASVRWAAVSRLDPEMTDRVFRRIAVKRSTIRSCRGSPSKSGRFSISSPPA